MVAVGSALKALDLLALRNACVGAPSLHDSPSKRKVGLSALLVGGISFCAALKVYGYLGVRQSKGKARLVPENHADR